MGLIITLILLGILLILAEILLIPGVGVAGIFGVLSLGGSVYAAFCEYGRMAAMIVAAVVVVLLILFLIWVLRSKTWKKMSLETNIESKARETISLAPGDIGRTVTRLAPMGTVRFGQTVIEATSLAGMIDNNVEVEVAYVDDNKVFVKVK